MYVEGTWYKQENGNEGAEHLVQVRALQHENCRVTDLILGGNNIDQSVPVV